MKFILNIDVTVDKQRLVILQYESHLPAVDVFPVKLDFTFYCSTVMYETGAVTSHARSLWKLEHVRTK